MKILSGKLNLLAWLVCLMAALFAIDAVSVNHSSTDHNQTKVTEFDLEECVAFAQRQRRRESRSLRQGQSHPPAKRTNDQFLYWSQCRFFIPLTERDLHNGFGGFLRT